MSRQRSIAAAFGIALAASGASAWAQNANVGNNDGNAGGAGGAAAPLESAAATLENTESLLNQLNQARAELERAREELEQAARGVGVASAAPFQRAIVTQLDGTGIALAGPSARIGLVLARDDNRVESVLPGSAAATAGIRAGDVIRSVDGEQVERDDLLARLQSAPPNEALRLGVERGGVQLEIEVEPRAMAYAAVGAAPGVRSFVVGPGGDGAIQFFSAAPQAAPASPDAPASPAVPGSPGAPAPAPAVTNVFRTFSVATAPLSDMELVPMTEGLSRYFGTSDGLLVVRGPQSDEIDIDDGDVILSVNGRKPSSPEHALRILGSYEPGETIEFSIMRDRQQTTVEYLVPASAQVGSFGNFIESVRRGQR